MLKRQVLFRLLNCALSGEIIREWAVSEENMRSSKTGSVWHDDQIDILEYWGIIWKRRKMIVILTVVIVIATAITSLFMKDIYEAKAVISPVSSYGSGGKLSSLASQLGGFAGVAGEVMPGSSSTAEIVEYLNSYVLREKVIMNYSLLPILFPDEWDEEKKAWKEPKEIIFITKALSVLKSVKKAIKPGKTKKIDEAGNVGPTIWDGLRSLDDIVFISSDKKSNTITISVNIDDPQNAANIVSYLITALNDHMSGESRRVAEANKKHLEEQLSRAYDPIIRQKIYTLLSQQVETALMSEVKENFAFKVIDPPKPPDKKIKPKRSLIVVVGFAMSVSIGIITAFIQDYIEKNRGIATMKKEL